MKITAHGRVVSHTIFQPNPKDEPDLELAKVGIVVSPATKESEKGDAGKHTKMVLVVEKETVFDKLVLGQLVRITLEDTQQVLPFDKPTKDAGGTSSRTSRAN